jgi:hypothetical protein
VVTSGRDAPRRAHWRSSASRPRASSAATTPSLSTPRMRLMAGRVTGCSKATRASICSAPAESRSGRGSSTNCSTTGMRSPLVAGDSPSLDNVWVHLAAAQGAIPSRLGSVRRRARGADRVLRGRLVCSDRAADRGHLRRTHQARVGQGRQRRARQRSLGQPGPQPRERRPTGPPAEAGRCIQRARRGVPLAGDQRRPGARSSSGARARAAAGAAAALCAPSSTRPSGSSRRSAAGPRATSGAPSTPRPPRSRPSSRTWPSIPAVSVAWPAGLGSPRLFANCRPSPSRRLYDGLVSA